MYTTSIKTRNTHHSGFTLVETLVAITVLLLVIIGPMTVAQKGIQNAYFANEQVTAVFLAQEAIEAVRELRDSDALDAYDTDPGGNTWNWYGNLVSDCKNTNGCAFDVVSKAFETCGSNNACKLRVSATGAYNYQAGGVDSLFTRKVFVGPSTNEWVPVTVEVTWDAKIFGASGNARSIKLQSWVYNHYKRYED